MHLGNTKELSGIPPGAFGGRRMPLNEDEESFLCSIKRMLPDAPDAGLLQWALLRIASVVPRDHALLRTLLIEGDLCPKPRPVARVSLVRTVVLAMDAEGVPVSTNATWNACIRGYVTLEQIRANPDRDQDGRARDCGWYHTGSLWRHPDAGIEFQWDREQGTAVAPEGYVFEKPAPLLSVR